MDRKIKHIIAENPFLTLEKIQSILLEHGSSWVPSSEDTNLSLLQTEWVYSYVKKKLNKKVSKQDEKKVRTVQKKRTNDIPRFKIKRKRNDRKLNVPNRLDLFCNKNEHDVHEEYLRKCSLGVSLPIHSFSGIQEIVKAAEYKYCLTSEFMLHLHRHIESDAVLKKYFIDNILEDFIEKNILSKRKNKENSYDRVLLSIFTNQSESQESSFDILTPKRFVLNWNDVKFFNGYFRIGPPRLGNINFATVDIKCPESICALNNLTNYFQQRLPAIHCVAKANKLTIEDEINLDQVIRYIKNASKQESLNPEEDGVKKKVSDQPVFFVRSLEESRRLGAKFDKESLKKFKSRYLNYLIDKQMGGYRVIPCNERVIHSSQLDNKTECAFIFTIAANSPRKVILAIENLNIDRATMLFSFERTHYERALRGIYEYLRSSEINKRSSLRRWESYGLGGIQIEYHAVNHRNSESYSWTEILKYRLRTM